MHDIKILPCIGGPLHGKEKEWRGRDVITVLILPKGVIPTEGLVKADDPVPTAKYEAQYNYFQGVRLRTPSCWKWVPPSTDKEENEAFF